MLTRARDHSLRSKRAGTTPTVMHGRLLIGWVQIGTVAAGLGYTRLRVVRHHKFRHALVKPAGTDVGTDPTFQLFVCRGFRVSVGTGSQHRDKQVRLLHGPPRGSWIGIVVLAQSTNSFS